MALESQGVLIKRISTVAGTTALSSGSSLIVDSTQKAIISNDIAANFLGDGFSSGMRVTISGATNNNTGIYTISCVASSVIYLHDIVTAQAVGDNLAIEAHRYDTIGQVKSFTGPGGAANTIDISHLGSTAKEFLVGLRNEGEVSMEVFYDPDNATAQQLALLADRSARTKRTFDISFNDSTVLPSAMNFDAYVQGFSISGAVDNAISANVSLLITSAVKYISKV